MRNFLLYPVISLLVFIPAVADEFVPGNDTNFAWVPFNPNYEQLVNSRKPGIIYFFSTKAVELCKHFETELFADNDVKSQSKKFVCIKVSSDDKTDVAQQFGVAAGEAAIVLVNIFGKVDDTLKAKSNPDAFGKALKKAYELSKNDIKKAKWVENANEKAERFEKQKKIAQAADIWSQILKEAGTMPHPLIAQIKAKYDKMKEAGLAALKPALEYGKQVLDECRGIGGSISALSSAQNQVAQALARIKEVLDNFPIPDVKEAASPTLTELSGLSQLIASEIARLKAEEEARKKQEEEQKKKQQGK